MENMQTKLQYLEDFNLSEALAKVISVAQENDRDVVVLDQTIFYPQGGGQPYDQGIIESLGCRFVVEEVRFVEGMVKHIGKFETGNFSEEETVACRVDTERRKLNARIGFRYFRGLAYNNPQNKTGREQYQSWV